MSIEFNINVKYRHFVFFTYSSQIKKKGSLPLTFI